MNTRTDRRGKLAPRRLGLRASPSGPELAARNSPPRLGRQSGSAGTEGNEILTSAAAVVLVCLLAAEGITIVHMRGLLSAHMFIGLVLIGPVLLKLGSTGYRMVRYYSGSRPYRVKGPPALPLRALAPVLVASTIAVLASGVLLLAAGHKSSTLVTIHEVSCVVHRIRSGLGSPLSCVRPARRALRTNRLDRSAPSRRARDGHERDAGRRRARRRRGTRVSAPADDPSLQRPLTSTHPRGAGRRRGRDGTWPSRPEVMKSVSRRFSVERWA
jgi:hypothetical protein